MKIRMHTLYAGPSGVMEAGSTHDVDAALGQALVEAGYAEVVPVLAAPVLEPPVEPAPETSALTVDKLEHAIKPRPRKKV